MVCGKREIESSMHNYVNRQLLDNGAAVLYNMSHLHTLDKHMR